MAMLKNKFRKILDKADVKINGNRDWDIKINDNKFYRRVMRGGVTGFGEAYVDGLWDCSALDVLFYKLLKADIGHSFRNHLATRGIWIKEKVFNKQKPSQVLGLIKYHYDMDNTVFSLMLDKYLAYSCGYWKNAKTLDKAQEDKLDLICKKIGLKKGMTILDIGCGWGSFVKFAAEKYGVKAIGITLSKEQFKYATKVCEGFPVEIKLQDYRSVKGKFDRVVSVGMFEHVGHKNYRDYMDSVHRVLKDNGLFLLHCFGGNYDTPNVNQIETRWVEKYIFHGMELPSISQIGKSSEGLFVMEDLHNFGADYDPTLMAWYNKFEKNWTKMKNKYDDKFYRMWKYYLLICAGAFRSRKYQLWQFVFSKNGVPGVYNAVR